MPNHSITVGIYIELPGLVSVLTCNHIIIKAYVGFFFNTAISSVLDVISSPQGTEIPQAAYHPKKFVYVSQFPSTYEIACTVSYYILTF